MSFIRRCDRCGCEAPSGFLNEILESLLPLWKTINLGPALGSADLCPDCVDALGDWIKAGQTPG